MSSSEESRRRACSAAQRRSSASLRCRSRAASRPSAPSSRIVIAGPVSLRSQSRKSHAVSEPPPDFRAPRPRARLFPSRPAVPRSKRRGRQATGATELASAELWPRSAAHKQFLAAFPARTLTRMPRVRCAQFTFRRGPDIVPVAAIDLLPFLVDGRGIDRDVGARPTAMFAHDN